MALTKVKLIADGTIVQSHLNASHGITTADIGENASNLYYTDARARAAVSVSGNALSYDSSTGVITSNYEESPTFTGNITLSGGHISLNANDDSRISGDSDSIDFNLWDNTSAYQTRMTILDTGNVGIGLTNPAVKLEIQDSAHTTMKIRSGNNDNILFAQAIQSNDARIGTDTNTDLSFYSNASERMRIDSSGNVGIGTTSPGHKLDVAGTVGINSNLTMSTSAEIRSSDGTGIRLRNAANSANEGGFVRSGLWEGDSSRDPSLFAETGLGLRFYTGGSATERMYINSSGNVGIGTTSPNHKLDIYSNENVPLRIHRPSNANLNSSGAWGIGFSTRGDAVNSTTDTRAGIFSYYNGNLFFATNTSSIVADPDGSARMTILNTGYVGINTTNPLNQFDVRGTAYITGYTVGFDTSPQGNYAYRLTNDGGNSFINLQGGNLGIGTTSPAKQLTLSAAIPFIRLQETGAGSKRLDLWVDSNAVAHIDANQSAQQITFRTASTDRLRIANNGNVGIGLTSPSSLLHLYKSSGDAMLNIQAVSAGDPGITFTSINNRTGNIFYSDGSTNAKLTYDHNDVSFKLYAHNTTVADFVLNETTAYFPTQNVGIGASSPAEKLTIDGTSSGAYVRISNAGSGDISSGYMIYNGSNLDFNVYTNPTFGNTTLLTREALAIRAGGSERMRITSGGNVGIGTTNPGTDLAFGGFGSIWVNNDPSNPFGMDTVGGELRLFVGASSNTYQIKFGRYNGSNFDTSMVIGDDGSNPGYVGIGTLNPSLKFHIAGSGSSETQAGISNSGTASAAFFFDASNGDFAGTDYMSIGQANDLSGFIRMEQNAGSFHIITGSIPGSNRLTVTQGGNIGIGTTSPEAKLDIKGCVAMGPAIYDGNLSRSTTNFSQQDGGSLHINWGLGGSSSSGDTITFTYAATSWKSWSLKYNFASTNGICQGVVGGYWNNSGSHSNDTQIDNLGVSVAVTHSGQSNIITFTFTALGTHPMANFVYMQSGGDGQPRMDRVTLNAVS